MRVMPRLPPSSCREPSDPLQNGTSLAGADC
jgi:hypothetical protein